MDPDMLLAWCPVSPQEAGDSIMMEGQQNKPIIWFLVLGGVLCDYIAMLSDTLSFPLLSFCFLFCSYMTSSGCTARVRNNRHHHEIYLSVS